MQELKLDYTIKDAAERLALVQKIIDQTPHQNLTNRYLQILADYIIFAMSKEQRKSKQITTDNRKVTINKRETSFQGLVSKFQSGEDGVYNLIIESDKNVIFTPKISITQEDVDTIPHLKQLRQAIDQVQQSIKVASGKKKFLLKKQLIEMRQDQYVIKMAYKKPMSCTNAIKSFNNLDIYENIQIDETTQTVKDYSLISLMNPKHISALLCNYSRLKQDSYDKVYTDGYYLLTVLQDTIDRALKEKEPLYYKLMMYKIDGKQNAEIQNLLYQEFGIKHSVEYISALWRKKIPKLIAEQGELDYLNWYYTYIKCGRYKTCSRCKQNKLATNKFFSKNSSSKDGFYSICKACRNTKKEKTKNNNYIIKRIPYVPQSERK